MSPAGAGRPIGRDANRAYGALRRPARPSSLGCYRRVPDVATITASFLNEDDGDSGSAHQADQEVQGT